MAKWVIWCKKLASQMRQYGYWQDENGAGRKTLPHPSDFLTRIINWILYWPLVGVWGLLNNPIRKAARMVYDEMVGIYVKIARWAFTGIEVHTKQD